MPAVYIYIYIFNFYRERVLLDTAGAPTALGYGARSVRNIFLGKQKKDGATPLLVRLRYTLVVVYVSSATFLVATDGMTTLVSYNFCVSATVHGSASHLFPGKCPAPNQPRLAAASRFLWRTSPRGASDRRHARRVHQAGRVRENADGPHEHDEEGEGGFPGVSARGEDRSCPRGGHYPRPRLLQVR